MPAYIVAYIGQDTRMYVTKEWEKHPLSTTSTMFSYRFCCLSGKFEFCSSSVRLEYAVLWASHEDMTFESGGGCSTVKVGALSFSVYT